LLKILNPRYFLYIMTKILITGATGFVGSALFENLKSKKNYLFHLSVRTNQEKIFERGKTFNIGEIDANTNWNNALDGVDCIVHCAARAHMTDKKQIDSLNAYRRVNVDATRHLAKQAVAIGIKRFIFLSSIKVNGEETIASKSFKYNDISQPEDAYGISKWEAEQALLEISKQTGLEVVIIRSPLVYGERVKGNFLRLLNLVYKQMPLPFAKINNLRSFIGLDNLIDLIICCIDHPKAGGKTFLVSDGEDLSTPDLIIKLSKLMDKSPRLFQFPQLIIQLIGRLVGKSLEVKRLLGSLRADNSYTREILGWSPVLSLDESLKKTVRWYLKNR
jgi:nucleoside-diphosphate-sugar epimerase